MIHMHEVKELGQKMRVANTKTDSAISEPWKQSRLHLTIFSSEIFVIHQGLKVT